MTTLLPPGPRKAKAVPNFSITWALTHSMCSLAEKTCISAAKQNPRCPQSTLNPRKSPQIPIIVLSPYVKPIPLAKIVLVGLYLDLSNLEFGHGEALTVQLQTESIKLQ
jgi:hypothetical protein